MPAPADAEPTEVERAVAAGRPCDRPGPAVPVARDAGRPGRSDLEKFFGWPSWSMDTGLTPAQEKFVEHWSPQHVLDESRLLRQLVMVLQRWSSTRGDDASLDEALTVLRDLQPQ